LIQTPELHSIHHQLDIHEFNFSDLPIWDRLFGTYRDADSFAPTCGFPRANERKLGRMLMFCDVYDDP
jgi:sterol desaturase/sphingolipid hydroxylase (fatty acid hydroxylase superfamily)